MDRVHRHALQVSFEQDLVLSQMNEYEILQLLMGDCREKLQAYKLSMEEDIKISQAGAGCISIVSDLSGATYPDTSYGVACCCASPAINCIHGTTAVCMRPAPVATVRCSLISCSHETSAPRSAWRAS